MAISVSDELLERFRSGDRRALARLITRLDNDPNAHDVLDRLGPPRERAQVVGLTGPPGVGKSTLVGGLIAGLRARGRRVAVLAVDPQSPISGGALLGDRVRMSQAAADDDDVFIRSLSSRGTAGGLSASVRAIVQLLERFGYDLVLVETIGVGQAEMAVLRIAQLVVLMVMPGTGDEVQWEKAGLIEVAHLIVLNKSDHPGADRLEQELREALGAGGGKPAPPIIRTVANRGQGIDEVIAQLELILADRPRAGWEQMRTEIVQEAEMLLGERLHDLAAGDARVAELAHEVAEGRLDLYSATERALEQLLPRLARTNISEEQTT